MYLLHIFVCRFQLDFESSQTAGIPEWPASDEEDARCLRRRGNCARPGTH